jgi:surface polysaccharide O-acyltransferase-like enzyme
VQFINNMRGIAILIIVYTHAIWAMPAPGKATPFLDYIVGNGTLVFIFIAGYLFSQTTDRFQYVPYLVNKIKTVLIPYLVVSLPASLLYVFHIKTTHQWIDMDWFFTALNPIERYLYLVATGAQLGPLWFVPMIVIFYIASPIFAYLKNSNFIFPLVVITLVIAYVAGRPVGNSNPFQSFLFFTPFYLLGMIAFRMNDQLMSLQRYIDPVAILYAVFIVALYFLFFSPPAESTDSDQLLIYLPLIPIATVFCRKHLNRRIPVLDMFGRLSFFIFFIHGYFAGAILTVTRRLFGEQGLQNAPVEFIVITGIFCVMTFLSLATYVVLKYFLKDRSRYVIGG